MIIKISNLNKSYNNLKVLDDLNLNIKQGSIFGLLGANAAGKTTLVSILNYLISKDSGKIFIDGLDLDLDEKKIKNISSYVPQTYAFYPTLTAYENLEFFGALYGLKNAELKARINHCIKATALEKFRNKQAQAYSGGVKRRLNIAIGLLNQPKILYLDEPTVGIDPQSRKYILDVIKNINKEYQTTIIYTSHYMEEIEYLCDEIAILDGNKIILQEKKDVLTKQNSIEIELTNETLKIDVGSGYEKFINVLEKLRNDQKEIININFGNKNLEKMFLSLTKTHLRD